MHAIRSWIADGARHYVCICTVHGVVEGMRDYYARRAATYDKGGDDGAQDGDGARTTGRTAFAPAANDPTHVAASGRGAIRPLALPSEEPPTPLMTA